MGSRGLGFGVAMIAHTIYGLDAIAAAQALSEIGYLLRQDPKEVFRAKAFSAAAWSLALQRPDLAALQRDGALTSIEGVGAGIAKVLADLVETGQSRYLARLREQMRQPAREDESALDFSRYQGDIHSHTDCSDGRATMLEMAEGAKALGHPTGRRPGSREGASYDIEAVFKEAAKHGVALEIDCDPARMDLSPEMARLALEWGCMFSVDADAHAPAEFAYVPMALWMARRAGIPEDRILNFRPTDELTMAHER